MTIFDKQSVNIMFFSHQTEQIMAEYKARALSCHPDKHPENPEAGKRKQI